MKRPISTQKRFFLRRTGMFFAVMMIPTIVLMCFILYFSVQRTTQSIDQKGQQTVTAVEANCELIISNVFTQNDLFTGTTRMNMALRHTLFGTSTSYIDAIFLSSLTSVLRSVVNTHEYIDSIYIYLDGASRYFDSYRGIVDFGTSVDLTWLPLYQDMPEDEKEMLFQRQGEYNKTCITFIKRTLMQKGCAVVNIAPNKLASILQTLLTRNHETITLLDLGGNILTSAGNDDSHPFTQADAAVLMELSGGSGHYQGWMDGDSGRWYINTGAYGDMLVVTSVTEQLLLEEVRPFISSYLPVLALNLLLILLLSFVTTRRSFSQISGIMRMFERAEKGETVVRPDAKVHDEYDMVMNNIIYLFLKENQLQRQLQENQLAKEHSELMALQLQINPHFLYNTLQTLEMEIKSGQSDRYDMAELVQRISDILRYALSNPQEMVPLQEELQYLRKYAAVQQYRFGDRFILYFEADDDLYSAPVFRLMLQPLVENSLIHGMKDTERLYIWVRAQHEGSHIRFTVTDTGAGMTREQLSALMVHIRDQNSRSIGLTNLNRRLLLLYGEESQLTIQSEPGKGMTVTFVIPEAEKSA